MNVGAVGRIDQCSFERDAEDALQGLRSALGSVVAAVPGGVSNAADLQRRLRIDTKLSWKVFKVVRASTPLGAGTHVPGTPSMRAFLKAAQREGVSERLIESVAEATREFEQVVATHAGDRAAFDSMASDLAANEDAERVDMLHRRAAFRSARHIWGMSAKTRLVTRVVRAGEDSNLLDIATVQGYLSLRKLRSIGRLVVSHARLTYDDGAAFPTTVEALAPEANAEHGIAIVPEFCSQPLPTIRAVEADDGFIAGELCGNGLGHTAAATCVVGSIVRGVPARWHVPKVNEAMKMYALIRMPCEVLILDTFVPEGFFAPGMPRALAFAESGDYSDYPEIEKKGQCAPLRVSVEKIGKGPLAVHTPDVPQYAELAKFLFDRIGTDGSAHDLYRCRIEYPVMPSMALVMFDLLQGPAE